MRIVNEPFPAKGGAWLLKVSPHDNQEAVTQGIGKGLQFGGIFIRRIGVMDGTWTDDDQKPIAVFSMKNAANRFSGFDDQRRGLIGNRQFGLDGAWGRQCLDFNNVLIVDRPIHTPPRSLVEFSRDAT